MQCCCAWGALWEGNRKVCCILEKQWRQQWEALSHRPQGTLTPITCMHILTYTQSSLTILACSPQKSILSSALRQLEVGRIVCVCVFETLKCFNKATACVTVLNPRNNTSVNLTTNKKKKSVHETAVCIHLLHLPDLPTYTI